MDDAKKTTAVQQLRSSLVTRWTEHKAAQGPYESCYRALPPELELNLGSSLLDRALKEEYERGRTDACCPDHNWIGRGLLCCSQCGETDYTGKLSGIPRERPPK